jgi:hypothetical protein
MTAGQHENVTPPAGLRERVLEASLRARQAGHTLPEVPRISPDEAFSRAADAFYGTGGCMSFVTWTSRAWPVI